MNSKVSERRRAWREILAEAGRRPFPLYSFVRPHRQFVAIRIGEIETAAAGEGGSPDMAMSAPTANNLWLSGRFDSAAYMIDTTSGAVTKFGLAQSRMA